jgi:hypothetical protein
VHSHSVRASGDAMSDFQADINAAYEEADKTGLKAESTASGPVRKHAGLWRKRGEEWCALVANEHNPESGEFVIIKRRDGDLREKMLSEKLEDRGQTSIWSVKNYDGRYDDNDPDEADFAEPF